MIKIKKILFGLFLLLSSICFAEIPRYSKVLYYETTWSAGSLASKLQEISNQYTIIDWQISIGSSASNYHGEETTYLLVVFVKEEV